MTSEVSDMSIKKSYGLMLTIEKQKAALFAEQPDRDSFFVVVVQSIKSSRQFEGLWHRKSCGVM